MGGRSMIRRLLYRLRAAFPRTKFHHRANGPVVINPDESVRIHVWGDK